MYDDKGYPTIVQIIPKFNIEDIDPELGSGVHPAFVVGGVEKPQIYIAVYPATVVDGRAVSISGKAPANYVTYDQAVQYCTAKGVGWHLMTNWEWAALALWCVKNNFQPRGNTNYRRSHAATYEVGGSVDGREPGETVGDGRTFGGSGPASWRHNNSFQGVVDLVGNVWEWQGGLKLIDGQIYMPNDNDFTLAAAQWPSQGVYLDASAGPGDGNGATYNGTSILSNGISKYSETPTPAGGGDNRDLDYTYIGGETGWQQTGISTGYNGLTLAVRQRMAQALIAPKIVSTGSVLVAAKGGIQCRNYGERVPIRGGSWDNGAIAGLGALYLYNRRVYSGGVVGFRPAFAF
ncbi:MAG: formylglycine-generating enzyme family protein [Treponema sp.]|nr:formylglycine-generating enzyme family protein [Treponema sp.]